MEVLLNTPLHVRLGEDIARRIGMVAGHVTTATWSETEQITDTLLDFEEGALARLGELMATASHRADAHGAHESAARLTRLANRINDLLLDHHDTAPPSSPAAPSPAVATAPASPADRRAR